MASKNYKLFRSTFDKIEEIGIPYTGIYIIAYLGEIIYIGIASLSIEHRIKNHMSTFSMLGQWLSLVNDYSNIRIDILEPPDDCENVRYWLKHYENKLIKKLSPLLNLSLIKD